MVAGCGAKIAKFILFVVNFLVWIAGIILIAVGAYAMVRAADYSYLFGNEDTLTQAAGLMIAVGVIIFIVGFCGCCGALKQSVCLLKIYFALVLLVIILEIVAGILAFVYQDSVFNEVEEQIAKAIASEYTGEEKNVPTETLDLLQTTFDCCGGMAIDDWSNSTWARDNGVAAPASCCKEANRDTADCNAGLPGEPSNPSLINEEGCVESFESWLASNYLMVGGVCIGLLVFEILALIVSCCLIQAIEKEDKQL